jgi:two-component system chemotaxis response regulator CheY
MGKRILIVDDAKTIRQQVNFTLKKAGYDVVEAEDGEDGIEKLKQNPDVAVIISDVNMPKLNGIDMVRTINEDADLPHPPILILTTESAPEFIKQAKSAGAKGWIVKPFKPESLIEAIGKLVS